MASIFYKQPMKKLFLLLVFIGLSYYHTPGRKSIRGDR